MRNEYGYENSATFPEELVGRILATYAKPGMAVIDPFAGSGTVGFACYKAHIDFTGIDISESSCQWMQAALSQLPQTQSQYWTKLGLTADYNRSTEKICKKARTDRI